MAGKNRTTRFRAWAILLPLALLGGCDSFSLMDLLVLPGEAGPLSIIAEATTVTRNGDPVNLSVWGGTQPYEFSVEAVDIVYGNPLSEIGYYNQSTYVPGAAIGRVRIAVMDGTNDIEWVNINVVPRTPSLNSVFRQGISDEVRIEWDYSELPSIDGFFLQRSVGAGDFEDRGPEFLPTDDYWIDTDAPSGISYRYRIFAKSGGYISFPAEDTVSP
jgi:hypothetical protein